jgi:hypothetical protein
LPGQRWLLPRYQSWQIQLWAARWMVELLLLTLREDFAAMLEQILEQLRLLC